ncbi:peptidoglycan DD-metalloendopeptidase family protein [Hazenella sp. IB182357]|uniref:Peptidoglycan DD-metalloendopeptidase family protein n=1 Tax=Polycladospora coralii TaxID=2771432 RepID=A0A926RX57_9BACL|nr:peptidoglycan DD-metalloendopeptidase family protein [Polycladospora coralii]
MKKKVLVGMISLSLVFALFPHRLSLAETDSEIKKQQEEIKERNDEIQELEKKQKETEEKEKDTLANIRELNSKLNTYDVQIYQLQKEVGTGEKQIEEIEREMKGRKKQLENRIREIYLKGDLYYFELLADSSSVSNFLDRYNLVKKLIRHDKRVMENYKQTKNELDEAQKKLWDDLTTLEQKKDHAQTIYKNLQVELKKIEKTSTQLVTDKQELEEVNEKQKEEVEALIAKATKEAREREIEQETKGQAPVDVYKGGKFTWPVAGASLTSPFGNRYHPIAKKYKMHTGIDIGAASGTPMKAVAPGEVIEARPSNGYGYIIVIYHGDGLSSFYAHMYAQTVKVKVGQKVKQGEVIAAVGSNGYSTGPHLHFEVHKDGKKVDPMPYFE